jgi:hypothetical protein
MEKDGNSVDAEKGLPSTLDIEVVDIESGLENDILPHTARSFWKKLSHWGIEIRGILPIPAEERMNTRYINIFSMWFTMSVNTLPYRSPSSCVIDQIADDS